MSGHLDLSPEHLVTAVDGMTWSELERTARAVLAGFSLVAEAPGAQRSEVIVSRGKATGGPPRSAPLCTCNCPSRRDHWKRLLDEATEQDVARDCALDVPEPKRFRHVVFRAAEDLDATSRAPGRASTAGAMTGPDLADFICDRYRGVAAERAAVLETRRRGRGHVSTAAIRRTRGRNGYGLELGEPQLPDEEIADQVLTHHRMGHSDREIARDLDIGRNTVAQILDGKRTELGTTTTAKEAA